MSKWSDLVDEGRKLISSVGSVQWRLGDLANEAVALRHGGDRSEGALADFAEEIGVEYRTLIDYRAVADKFPEHVRIAYLPWSLYRVLAPREDRFALVEQAAAEGWTVTQALAHVERVPAAPPRHTEVKGTPPPTAKPQDVTDWKASSAVRRSLAALIDAAANAADAWSAWSPQMSDDGRDAALDDVRTAQAHVGLILDAVGEPDMDGLISAILADAKAA